MKKLLVVVLTGLAILAGPVSALASGGGAGDDVLYGTAQADVLSGGPGNDVIFGKSGDDVIRGGLGQDAIWGGPGFDVCYVEPKDLYSGCEDVRRTRKS
ncbi:MAG: hypothetical protein ACRDIC_14765 [bacterium]